MLNTQIIGQAESALGALLDQILAAHRTTFAEWLVLTVTASSGESPAQAQVVERIADARKMETAPIMAAIEHLCAEGLVAVTDGRLALTGAGQARFGQVRSRVQEVTAPLFADLPASELEIAGRVLSIVTTRANSQLAAAGLV